METIFQAIGQILKNGIILSRDALFFLDSSFGISTAPELEKVLGEEDFPEREMILEYLMFPDKEHLIALEPVIDLDGLTAETVAELARQLVQEHCCLTLFHPEYPDPLHIQISLDQMETFVSRLNLTRKMDPDIHYALEKFATASDALSFKILLRSKNYGFSDEKKQFILEFIEKSERHPHKFVQVFELCLDLLSQAPEPGNLVAFFLERQQREKNMLKRIRKFEEKLARYNMEYLMLSKYPIPPESVDTVAQRLEKLNIIIWDILGMIPRPDVDLPVQDLGYFDPRKDMGRLVQTLS